MKVAVLGASNDPSRYAYMAMSLLMEKGHEAIPVHPRETEVCGQKVWPNLAALADAGQKVDTVTMYVGHALSDKLEGDLLKLAPRRVIINPGAENPRLEKVLEAKGMEVVHACTLVMLRVGNFE
jgi:predicted CoA-binding protein